MPKASQHFSYLKALQRLADESQRELAALMPHSGERGRIAEEIIRNVLLRILPKRFSIGTGVIISSKGDVSQQTDIVIFDNFFNSPLLSEFGSCVYPVEAVYATIECQIALNPIPLSLAISAPFEGGFGTEEPRSPRRSWSGLCSRGDCGVQRLRFGARFLKRQLSFPVSMISQ